MFGLDKSDNSEQDNRIMEAMRSEKKHLGKIRYIYYQY